MLLRTVALGLLSLLLVTTGSPAATPDEVAKFLAGLPLRDTSLAALGKNKAWAQHATDFDAAWKSLEHRQLEKIRAWGAENLMPEYSAAGNVFYFFSGPDQLYAQAFFPNAANYVLVAREPVGSLPEPEKIPAAEFAPALGNLHQALNEVLSFSFFITQKMKTDLHHQQLNGTLPVILVFLARSGVTIDSVELIGLDKEGAITQDAKPASHGAKIAFKQAGKDAVQNVYYFETDLSDEMLKRNDSVMRFCDHLGRGSSLIKAASYLLPHGNFETVKKFVMTHSDVIVQDDSGIPYRQFKPEAWTVRLYGHYDGPIKSFAKELQPDLAAAYKAITPAPLGFSFGYQWYPNKSTLIEARPK